MEIFDWSGVSGSHWYEPEHAQAAVDALAGAASMGQAARAVAMLRDSVSNDHAGTLYPAAVPATNVFLTVIADQPGAPREEALAALLDWWGCFVPDLGFETYEDPADGPINVCQGIVDRVQAAENALRRVADDPSNGGHHRSATKQLIALANRGWTINDA